MQRAELADRPDLVSVITIAFNSRKTIERTIDSIVAQTHPDIEYIVIDGASTDGTVDVLRSRGDDIDMWLSEPDRGISDALNKGIALARGQYIALVNSDDWLEPTHLAVAIEELRKTGADFVFGDLMFHPTASQAPYVWRGERNYTRCLQHTMPDINHPTLVCRRTVYEMHGLFDTRLSVAMDFEWLLRGYKNGVVGTYSPGITGHMSMEGISHRDAIRALREVREVSIDYGYPKALARLRYLVRCTRTRSRVVLKSLIPKTAYDWLRHKVNPHYHTLDA